MNRLPASLLAPLFAASALALAAAPASATVLGFDGEVCSAFTDGSGGLVACGNGGRINQAYGDTASLDVTWAQDTNPSVSMLFWADAYSGLTRIAYGGTTPTITLATVGLNTITLAGFDLGAWPNIDRGSQWTVTDLADGSLVASSGGPITILGSTPTSVMIGATSAAGFAITFGPDGFNVGIDNIAFSVTAVPEPGTWAMLAAGLIAMGAVVRRRRG
jgi:hypothetical protein